MMVMDIAMIMERFPVLKERRAQPAGNFSGGEQQMLYVRVCLPVNAAVDTGRRAAVRRLA